MSLTAAQIAARDGRLTASRVAVLMTGDEAAILNLWRELVGDPAWQDEDLSDVWPVQLGSFTEPLNLDWYERREGRPVTRRGEVVVHPEHDWAACTLDGFDAGHPAGAAVIEAKHVNGFSKLPDVVARYFPQLHWQMWCTGARVAVLTVIVGAQEPAREVVGWDDAYAADLIARAEAFWRCVETLTPPVAMPAVAAPARPEQYRTIDLDAIEEAGEVWPNWAYDMQADLASWAEHKTAADRHAAAAKAIKDLLPDDVGSLTRRPVVITRAKNGAVSIKRKEAA